MDERTVIDFRINPFIMVTKSVVNDDEVLTKPVELAVYVVLCMYADNHTKESHPSIGTIAKKARCGERTARRALQVLEEAGYIAIIRRFDSRGQQESNQYILLDCQNGKGVGVTKDRGRVSG